MIRVAQNPLRQPLHAVFALLLVGVFTSAAGAQREPLLQEGKKTIYERVLTRPDARLTAKPGDDGEVVPAFSRFYVYARQNTGDSEWLEVGANHQGKTDGWLRAATTVPWKWPGT